jgi:hypothetical protein
MTAAIILMLFAAPAPPAKPVPVPAIVPGVAVMTWRGLDAVTHFHDGGFYACHWQGRWWHGTWSQAAGVLTVEEWPLDNPDGRSSWEVRLSSPTAGTLGGDSAWAVRPVPAERVD